MNRLSTTGVLAAFAVMLGVVVVTAQRGSTPSVVGVWRVSEVTLTGPNARKIMSPQPSVRIFTRSHYSINEVTADKPRAELPASNATDKQLVDAFSNFTGQAGTYEIKGNELTTKRIAALNPNIMRSGSFATLSFTVEGNTLTLVQKSNQDGPTANPTTWKLTRVE